MIYVCFPQGSNSELADTFFPDRRKVPYQWGCFWATMNLPEGFDKRLLHQRCRGAKNMMGILPVRDTGSKIEAALYWSGKIKDLESLTTESFMRLKDEMLAFWPEASAAIAPLAFSDFVAARYNDIWISKPFKGRIVAIGDVAHGTSPQLGQGCTMALLDA